MVATVRTIRKSMRGMFRGFLGIYLPMKLIYTNYLKSYKNQDGTSEPFGREMNVTPHFDAYIFAEEGHDERHESYPSQRIIDLMKRNEPHTRERKTDTEGVNAGGYGKHQQYLEARRVYAEIGILALLDVAIANHLEPQKTEKDAGNPSVDLRNAAQQVAK